MAWGSDTLESNTAITPSAFSLGVSQSQGTACFLIVRVQFLPLRCLQANEPAVVVARSDGEVNWTWARRIARSVALPARLNVEAASWDWTRGVESGEETHFEIWQELGLTHDSVVFFLTLMAALASRFSLSATSFVCRLLGSRFRPRTSSLTWSFTDCWPHWWSNVGFMSPGWTDNPWVALTSLDQFQVTSRWDPTGKKATQQPISVEDNYDERVCCITYLFLDIG